MSWIPCRSSLIRAGLRVMTVYDTTVRSASYYASYLNDFIRSIIDVFSGDQEMWYFYDEFNFPVQGPVVAGDNRDIMIWVYLKRAKQFIYRNGGSSDAKERTYPWLSASLVIPNIHEGEEPTTVDFCKFLEDNTIRCNKDIIPTPNMLLAAWCAQHCRWLTVAQRRGAYFDVITEEGEDMRIPAWINTIRGYGVWCESVGKEFPSEVSESESDDEDEEAQVAPEPEPSADAPPTNKKTD